MELAIRILNFVAPYLPKHIYNEALLIIKKVNNENLE